MINKITTIDIEASGMGPDSYPIEIGLVFPNGDSWCRLVTPVEHWTHWSAEAESIHFIQRDQLFEHGKDIYTIAKTLNELLGDAVVYSDCWVLDEKWLRTLFMEAKINPTFKLRDIMYLLQENDFNEWEPLKSQAEKELNVQRHRATNDAKILQEAYYRLCQHR